MIHFGLFMVKLGLVSPEQIVKALDYQRERQVPIGKIALEHHFLKMNQRSYNLEYY